jgi:hypothetical protein
MHYFHQNLTQIHLDILVGIPSESFQKTPLNPEKKRNSLKFLLPTAFKNIFKTVFGLSDI